MRTLAVLTLGLFLAAAPAALAADAGIAFMDVAKVASECDALKDARKDLDGKFGQQKAELEKERGEIDKLIGQYQEKEPTEEQATALRKREREFADKAQAFMRLLSADEARVRGDVDTVVNRAAKELATRKGLSMIFDVTAVAYFDPKLDVTDEMIGEANVQWKNLKPAAGASKK